ncbi:MAG: D-alanyl-D-alanine carboxypeptidase, partial [Geodermatophilaceae bacterium]|nr:D-alanyl-D-alanine carboxypeptidase [Geodermatophilaceae bacterium]
MRPGERRPVTAPVYRRRRIAVGALVLLLVAAATFAVIGLVGGTDPGGSTTPAPVARTPQLPPVVDPTPVLAADAGAEPVPDPALLAGMLAPELSDPRLGGRVNGQVLDVATGDVLFEQSADRAVIPASTAKLATALAVESAVPAGLRLSTIVRTGAVPGQIVLVGGGDPTLSSAAEGNTYPGSATVADLAAQVAAGGLPVSAILVDSTRFSGPTTGPGWGQGDAPSRYAAPIMATMVDGGRFGPVDDGVRSGEPDLEAGRALAAALGVPTAPVSA